MDDPQYIGFYAAIHLQDLSNVESIVVKYFPGQYLISAEWTASAHKATDGWHMHFLVYGEEAQYRNLIQKLKIKYKLVGKTMKDTAHGYGRVRGELRDTQKYISYILKDHGSLTDPSVHLQVRWLGFPLDYLQKLQLLSYPKIQPNDIRDEIMNFIGEIIPYIQYDPDVEYQLLCSTEHPCKVARERIIQYYQEKTDKAPTRSRVQYLMMHYFVQHNKFALTTSQIGDWFYA